MFLGHHLTQLKSSSRLMLPEGWSKKLTDGFYLTQGFDQNLLILSATAFSELYERISALSLSDPLARMLLRMFLGTANYMELKAGESPPLPPSLLSYANLKSKAILVGQGKYVEIWSPSSWSAQEAEIQDAQANARRFSAFNLAIHS
ncbi:MAG: hypothetical protein IT310_14515 [Anaerolineales bacterium]|nr:hypothetical protein [Anaerolineales bacterium]